MKPQEKLNPTNPMNVVGGNRRGLGDVVQTVIHAGLDIIPMPAATRTAIKGCAGCRKRKNLLNRMVPNVNPFHR